jgi:hypothetical protein
MRLVIGGELYPGTLVLRPNHRTGQDQSLTRIGHGKHQLCGLPDDNPVVRINQCAQGTDVQNKAGQNPI